MKLQSKWVRIYAIFICVFAFFAGIVSYMSPESLFSMVNIDWQEAKMITSGFGARNIAIGVLAIIALLGRNLYVFQALFITRIVIDLQDLMNALLAGPDKMHPTTAILSLLVMFIIPLALGILQIRKEIKTNNENK